MPDPTQLKTRLETWREQVGEQSPLPLLLAENLFSRAEKEREAVAQKLYQRIEACLEQRGAESTVAGDMALEETPTETSSPLAPLLEALKRERQTPQAAPLSKLDRQLQEQNSKLLGEPQAEPQQENSDAVVTGLRAANRFQQYQLKHAKHRKVRIALEQRPENPGPLNPHMLAVKILNEIQAVSPAYLDRFVSYVDALNALQQSREQKNRKSGRGKSSRK